MDPVSAAGLAVGVASIGLQVYTGCIQGIQLLITAKNFPEECKYLNLRLRMEQQRLFAWSETSGLVDADAKNPSKILQSNTFVLHRTTVLDLLVQIQCLFKEFQDQQKLYKALEVTVDQDEVLDKPEKDASQANFPLSEKRRNFIKKAMSSLKDSSKEGILRLRWASFDKKAFETLLHKFAKLNDSMTDLLDARMQAEIHHTVQDTNRGVLQLHHKIADLSRLVMALNVKFDQGFQATYAPMSTLQKEAREADASALRLLSQLAKFKAFNESIEPGKQPPWDEATAMCLELGKHGQSKNLILDGSRIEIDPRAEESGAPRCEAILTQAGGKRTKVWIEWTEYGKQGTESGDTSPPKRILFERVSKLAALLNHSPKPEAFRTPHCLGFFDRALTDEEDEDDVDILNLRFGLVFERPKDDALHTDLPPVSLHELLQPGPKQDRKPSLTDRIKLAHAIANCLLYLHAVNWLHKGLRSHNVVFFRTDKGHIDYGKPYLSGFDFSRPAQNEEMTGIGTDDVELNLYRHPNYQSTNPKGRERYKKSFDAYSLGVVLHEIAHWSTIDKVLSIDLNTPRSQVILSVQDQLLTDERSFDLASTMGNVFAKVARKCVAGGSELGIGPSDDETQDDVAATLSMAFYEDVVKQLQKVEI